MYFKEKIKELFPNEEINIFVDMDGVIADYNFNKKLDFKDKRPITTNIKTLKELSKQPNINLFILSICKTKPQIQEKNEWLDKYAPFFPFANRFIIAKSENPDKTSKELKMITLAKVIKDLNLKNVCLIDDDNAILKHIKESNLDIELFQDSSIID